MIKFILLSIMLTALNFLIWLISTGTYAVWESPSSEGKGLFTLWMGACLILPIIIGFAIKLDKEL